MNSTTGESRVVDKPKTVAIDIAVTPEERRVFENLVRPALTALFNRANIHSDFKFGENSVSIELYNPEGWPPQRPFKEMLAEKVARLAAEAA